MSEIYVVKRNGKREEVHFEKVQRRIKNNSNKLNVSSNLIAQKVCSRIYDGVSTEELDELTAEICTGHLTEHPDYEILAKRIIISNNHKITPDTFSDSIKILFENNLISHLLHKIVMENKDIINSEIKHINDYLIDYFGFKTLQKSYLKRVNNIIIDRPQYLFMRVSLGLHPTNLKTAFESYNLLSKKYFIHATPTLFHSGTDFPQLLSCFLLGTEDSVSGIYKNISDCAKISKWAGGLGVHINNVRGKKSIITSSNGYSNGIIPMLRVYNETAKYINQCFTPETNIQIFDINSEEKETVRQISKIEIGDLVMTIDSNYKKVINVIKNTVKKEIYYISNELKNKIVRVTGEHEIYIKRGFINEYIPVSELLIGDLVCYPDINQKYKWYPINHIKKIMYKGDVYDLTVEENHSYVVDDLGIVHNSGKRNGSIAIYLEPYHPDIMDFLELRKNNGSEDMRTRDLFLALMIPDLFMRRVEEAIKNPERIIKWSLFDSNKNPELLDLYGEEFDIKYEELEKKGSAVSTVDISKLWKKILSSQIETGTPYILYKDQINKMSNQSNVGTIKSSNLCAEIVEYSDSNEYACCCLASISLGELVELPLIDKEITIYSKTDCIYCKMTITLLDNMKLKYNKILVDNENERNEMYMRIGSKYNQECNTVPQILIMDKYIGGYTDLIDYLKPKINYDIFEKICDILVRNLNKVIDINYYPVKEAENSNFKMRPLGIGVQGFMQMLLKMGYSFECNEAKLLNKQIFEAMQYFCMKSSCKIAEERKKVMDTIAFQEYLKNNTEIHRFEYDGDYFTIEEIKTNMGAYEKFQGSPLSYGIFQWEKYGVQPNDLFLGEDKWNQLRVDIMKYGIRNSLLVALMPTASTSQILGNTECFEPMTSNIYTRRTLAGDFIVLNRFLVDNLLSIENWTKETKDTIISENGSIANMTYLPYKMREIYKTVWEIKQKSIIDLAADRSPFVCQTQSMNLFFEEPKIGTLGSALIYGWKRGLKTGSYYIRSRPKIQAQQFTIDPKLRDKIMENNSNHICDSCSG